MTLKSLATWNVNSIAARLPLVLQWLETARPDVLCLQEIKCVEAKFPVEAFTNLGYESLVYGQPTYNGVATLIRTELAATIEFQNLQKGWPDDLPDAQRRLLDVTVGGVRVLNVYIPNGQAVGSDKYVFKLDWLARLRSYLNQQADPTRPLALCGDFNVAPTDLDVHDPARWEGQVLVSPPERAAMQEVAAWGLTDSFRQHYPNEVAYSWWDYRQASFRRNAGLRIDHIWLTPPLAARCRGVTIDPVPRGWERPSDHTPVVAYFEDPA